MQAALAPQHIRAKRGCMLLHTPLEFPVGGDSFFAAKSYHQIVKKSNIFGHYPSSATMAVHE